MFHRNTPQYATRKARLRFGIVLCIQFDFTLSSAACYFSGWMPMSDLSQITIGES